MSFLSSDPLHQPHQATEHSARDCANHALPADLPVETAYDSAAAPGRVQLDADLLRRLRQAKFMSQQDLADDCWRRNIQLSLSTIKRAELGRAVRFRIVREFARCFDVSTARVAASEKPASTVCSLPAAG